MERITTVFAYAYWPLLYFGVYMPLVVPRLHQWSHIPFWITWIAFIGFILVLAASGMREHHKSILIHAFGIALFRQAFVFAMPRLHMPSFLKSYEAGFFPEALARILILTIVAGTLGECDRFFVKPKKRNFQPSSQGDVLMAAPHCDRCAEGRYGN